jgi:hypothetical protein
VYTLTLHDALPISPRPPLLPGKTRYLLCRRLGGLQGRSGRAGNLFPTGIRSRTFQPVALSLYIYQVKWSRYRPGVTQRVGRGIAVLFHDRGTRRWWVVSITPRPHFTLGERPGNHFTGGWVGPRAGLDRCGNFSSEPGIDPRTVQAAFSRYTDWATGPTTWFMLFIYLIADLTVTNKF